MNSKQRAILGDMYSFTERRNRFDNLLNKFSISKLIFWKKTDLVTCPCCGYPTLDERAGFDICELCNWEDDGQDDPDADDIWGGPNGSYSLSDARSNFEEFGVMYSPSNDSRVTGEDSPMERHLKSLLM